MIVDNRLASVYGFLVSFSFIDIHTCMLCKPSKSYLSFVFRVKQNVFFFLFFWSHVASSAWHRPCLRLFCLYTGDTAYVTMAVMYRDMSDILPANSQNNESE